MKQLNLEKAFNLRHTGFDRKDDLLLGEGEDSFEKPPVLVAVLSVLWRLLDDEVEGELALREGIALSLIRIFLPFLFEYTTTIYFYYVVYLLSFNKLSSQVADDVKKHLSQQVYETIIPRNVRVSEAPSFGMPALIYDQKAAGSQAYLRLADEIIRQNKEQEAA